VRWSRLELQVTALAVAIDALLDAQTAEEMLFACAKIELLRWRIAEVARPLRPVGRPSSLSILRARYAAGWRP
jgi:hypothetical protein